MESHLRERIRHAVSGLLLWATTAAGADDDAQAREAMVAQVRDGFRATAGETGIAELSGAVAAALLRVPRHEFVPAPRRARAYADTPLPIGHGQTISQPYIVALMTELLAVRPGMRVLEVGTGSGYQAAVLAELGAEVWTVEIVEPLGEQAARVLARLGYDRVRVRIGDGYAGWPEAAPFDGILVTAAPEAVPPPLLDQLAPGGRLVVPVGGRWDVQHLLLVARDADGALQQRRVLPVRFVPLTGER